eukprot:gene8468-11051_t
MNDDWHATPQLNGDGGIVRVPAANVGHDRMVAGSKDLVVTMSGGEAAIRERLPKVCAHAPEMTILPGAGHWIRRQ